MSGASPELTFCFTVVVKSWSATYWTSIPLLCSNASQRGLEGLLLVATEGAQDGDHLVAIGGAAVGEAAASSCC